MMAPIDQLAESTPLINSVRFSLIKNTSPRKEKDYKQVTSPIYDVLQDMSTGVAATYQMLMKKMWQKQFLLKKKRLIMF